jgi:hydrophobic/amphiphilic exporter-1 (mainly G- bacteria), HAE1 family
MYLTRLSLGNPIAVTLLYALVGIVGLVAFARMGRSVLPPVQFAVVSVSAPYPGAAPNEIERLVIAPIEEKLDAVSDVERISASAQEGLAQIQVRFRFDSNIEIDRNNVQQAVDAARPNMPADLVPPVVQERDPSQAPIIEESVSSAVLTPRALTTAVETRIAPALRATNGVGSVLTAGGVPPQLTVIPRLGALSELGGTPLDVVRAVASVNDIFPGGRLRSPLRESTIGVRSAASTAVALRAVPLALPGGESIRLGDVAAIRDEGADAAVRVTVDGRPAIVLSIGRNPGADTLATIAAARATLARISAQYPLIRFTALGSDAPYTAAATGGVIQTLGEGIVLTVVVILCFLRSWRNALIATVSIPASLCAALCAMWAARFSIDVLSLMGLSLTVGILVDDSIVIVEAIAEHARRGLQGDAAAIAGRNELGAAAFAITLVDVAVFAPIALMSGVIGQFMREFGLTVVFATAFSLLVSFTLTPLLAARWALRRRPAAMPRRLPWMLRKRAARAASAAARALPRLSLDWEGRLTELYAGRWLPAAWRRRRVLAVLAGTACAAALWLVVSGRIATEFSPPASAGRASVSLTFPAGTPLERSDAAAARLADRLLEDPAVRHVVVTAGTGFNGAATLVASNLAQIQAVMEDETATADPLVERIKAMQPLVPDAQIAGAGRGMGGTAPIDYTVTGAPGVIDLAAARIAAALETSPYATDVRVSDAGVGPRLDVAVDPAKAVILGVSTDDAARTARIGTGGTIAARVRTPLGLTDVVVRSDAALRGDLDAAMRLPVRSADARLVPLADLSTVTTTSEPSIVQRENGERVVSVTANTTGSEPIGRVTGPMTRRLRDPNFLPGGTRIEPRGDIEQFLETSTKILATLGLSIVVVYVILAILYRSYGLPFAVILTVPLASIGAFGTLFLTNQPLNLYSMLGIVMLVGLVAKNGILLVDYAEREVRCGASPYAAMTSAARRRLRPILMTTAAMIAGMLPLALGQTIGAQYRQALGVVVIGGLSSSLLLTLFVVPVAYIRYRRGPAQPCFAIESETRVSVV